MNVISHTRFALCFFLPGGQERGGQRDVTRPQLWGFGTIPAVGPGRDLPTVAPCWEMWGIKPRVGLARSRHQAKSLESVFQEKR